MKKTFYTFAFAVLFVVGCGKEVKRDNNAGSRSMRGVTSPRLGGPFQPPTSGGGGSSICEKPPIDGVDNCECPPGVWC